MTRLLGMVSVLALLGVPAFAEEATGFREFRWGTSFAGLAEAVAKECRWHMTVTTLEGHRRFVCTGYQMPELGGVFLQLDFIDDRLRGYRVMVPGGVLPALTATAPQILRGAAAAPFSGTERWRATVHLSSSSLSFECPPRRACLTVKTY